MRLVKDHIEPFLQRRLIQHIAFWLFVLFYFVIGYTRDGRYGIEIVRSAAFLPNHMLLVYTFLYFILPKFLFTRKFLLFALFSILAYASSMALSGFINFIVLGNWQTLWSPGAALLGQCTVLGIAISIKLLKNWYHQKQQIMEAHNQKISAELELLKSQVHPHFLFNTLNNLYAHALKRSAKTPAIVLKLSDLLRFMIYESGAVLIPLKREIFLLQQYIELEQLRYGERLDISVSVRGQIENKQIVPLLLLPLVENAFKHGVSKQLDQCWISFDLEVNGNEMIFKLVNSMDRHSDDLSFSGGLGLQNVRKRLDYLYPGRHELDIFEEGEIFVVNLNLQLAENPSAPAPMQAAKNRKNDAEMLIG